MCGIIFGANTSTTIKGKKQKPININNIILNQYEDQESRGSKGFGILRINKNKKIEIDRACEPTKFMLDLYLKPSTMILAHHRQPTATENKIKQTHPIKVSNDMLNFDYYVVHNGLINNDDELRKIHMKLGFKYTTDCYEKRYQNYELKWNDSEAIAIELALFIENKIEKIRTNNGAAFTLIQVDKKTETAKKVFFGRNGSYSCLKMSKTRGNILISSEGKGNPVKENKLYSFDVKDPNMKLTSKNIPFGEIVKYVPPEKETTIPKGMENPRIAQEIISFEDGKTADEKEKEIKGNMITVVRNWININEDIVYDLIKTDPIFTDKKYKERRCEDFSNVIKGESTTVIKQEIEAELGEEEERISDIITNFKELCLTQKVTDEEKNFYLSQIANILTTMETLTNLASIRHADALEEELDDAMNSYTSEDRLLYDNLTGGIKREKRVERLLEKPQNNSFGFRRNQLDDDDEEAYYRSMGGFPIC